MLRKIRVLLDVTLSTLRDLTVRQSENVMFVPEDYGTAITRNVQTVYRVHTAYRLTEFPSLSVTFLHKAARTPNALTLLSVDKQVTC